MSLPEDGRVHIWTAHNNCPDAIPKFLEETLSSAERTKASAFRFDHHRIQYLFAHGVLRQILAGYCRCIPQELTFETNDYGKPFVGAQRQEPALTFNMSHSENMVLVALTVIRSIGVDVEFVRPISDLDDIAGRYFIDKERALIAAARHDEKERLFYVCWTRKEACLKAVGKGLSIPLDSFGTAMPLGTSGRHLSVATESQDARLWWLSDLAVPREYVGALVIEGSMPQIDYFDWTFPAS